MRHLDWTRKARVSVVVEERACVMSRMRSPDGARRSTPFSSCRVGGADCAWRLDREGLLVGGAERVGVGVAVRRGSGLPGVLEVGAKGRVDVGEGRDVGLW